MDASLLEPERSLLKSSGYISLKPLWSHLQDNKHFTPSYKKKEEEREEEKSGNTGTGEADKDGSQTHEMFKRALFIRTKNNMKMFWVIRSIKPQNVILWLQFND